MSGYDILSAPAWKKQTYLRIWYLDDQMLWTFSLMTYERNIYLWRLKCSVTLLRNSLINSSLVLQKNYNTILTLVEHVVLENLWEREIVIFLHQSTLPPVSAQTVFLSWEFNVISFFAYVYACEDLCVGACMCVYVSLCMCVYVCMCMCVCGCVYSLGNV